MLQGPLVIAAAGWTPMRLKRQGRDATGRRVERIYKRHEATGQVTGFEHRTADDRQHAVVQVQTVEVAVRPSDFGMSRSEFTDLLADLKRRYPPRQPLRHAGLHIPGEDITWH